MQGFFFCSDIDKDLATNPLSEPRRCRIGKQTPAGELLEIEGVCSLDSVLRGDEPA